MSILTQAELKAALHYDPETGIFTRVKTTSHNARAGDVAGNIKPSGYVEMYVNGSRYYAHRLAFLYLFGSIPDGLIDHADGDKSNNRMANLRPASMSENLFNRGATKASQTGVKGVYPHPKIQGRFVVHIKAFGVHRYVGAYSSISDAIAARRSASKAMHGEFARA